jgi:ubiquinone/menaquinone biosynthesis C-methylase UbiE
MVIKEAPSKGEAAATSAIQRRYDRQAATYDLCEAPLELLFSRWRRRLWELVPPGSRVLEVGVGTGKNVRWYPPDVSVTAVDFSPKMLSRAARRARRQDVRPQLALMDAQALAFADASFDVAVATCVFCSVPDPLLGLQEVRRVLRPDGRLFLLEHVRSGLPGVGRCMDWLNPVAVRMNGVNINRDTVRNVERAGFRLLEVDELFMDIVKLIVAEGIPADNDRLFGPCRA